MRTTLNIDDDVLYAARGLARREGGSVGKIVSQLARQALQAGSAMPSTDSDEFFGFRSLPKRGVVITNELVDSLRDDEGIYPPNRSLAARL